ncbi:hypothetical protein PISMIDRAFT_687079, partial [Pisolithus microcarpus 441]
VIIAVLPPVGHGHANVCSMQSNKHTRSLGAVVLQSWRICPLRVGLFVSHGGVVLPNIKLILEGSET